MTIHRSVRWFRCVIGVLVLLLAACGGSGSGPEAAAQQFADAVVANDMETARTFIIDESDFGERLQEQVERESGGVQSASVESAQTSESQSSVIIHWQGSDALIQSRFTFQETAEGWKLSGIDPGYWQIIPN
jgi:hypothetical protein